MCIICFTLAGCTSTTASKEVEQTTNQIDTFTRELRQNDYRGGYTRSIVIKDMVLQIVESMKQNNSAIRDESPNTYWTSSGYQDFVSNFIVSGLANDTQWFNEEETSFDVVSSQMYSVANSFTKLTSEGYKPKYASMIISRNEKDDYSIYGISDAWSCNGYSFKGAYNYRILYDCDKDWCKAYSQYTTNVAGLPTVTTDIYEYARLNADTFLIQTGTERLYVKYEPVKEDMDLRNRTITEFYYSRLSAGQRTTFEPYTPTVEADGTVTLGSYSQYDKLMESYPIMNEKGDLATRYGVNDSVFTKDIINSDNPIDWVFEDKALQQTIVYKNNNLVVTTYNKLTDRYEQYIFYRGDKPDETAIALTPLNEFVGVQSLPEDKSNLYQSEEE